MDSLDSINEITGLVFEPSDEQYTNEILDIFNNKRDQHLTNPALYNYIGISYMHLDKDYNKAKEYFILAVEYNCDAHALINLASFYTKQEQNYQNVIKYYLMGIEKHNDKRAMNGLGYFYDVYEKNTELAEKYYIMAIEHGNRTAISNLAYLYSSHKKYDKAIKYCLMSIKYGNSISMYSLGNIYYHLKKYDDAFKYYLMAMENGDLKALRNIVVMVVNNTIKEQISCNINSFIKFCQVDSNNIHYLEEDWDKLFNEFEWIDICIQFNRRFEPTNIYTRIYKFKLLYHKKIGECNICYNNDATLIPINWCNHLLCNKCYISLYTKPCPHCRFTTE